MKSRYIVALAALCGAWSLAANAGRDTGWEFGGELIYQDSADLNGSNGSTGSLDSDLGIALTFAYRMNERLEFSFGLDWNNVDYNAHIISETFPGTTLDITGELEAFTPRVGVNFNFMDGPITPYVSGMIGYAFVDTNIPNGLPVSGCWWDPWYGQVCGTWQDTKTKDSFVYGLGVGVRWDVNDAWSVRFGYDKRWVDADSSVDLDQIKLGVSVMY